MLFLLKDFVTNICFFLKFPYAYRIRDCLAQLYTKDITPDDKQELDEALQREVSNSS